MDDILQVNHLFKSYGDFQLKDVSFRMEKGTIMGFVDVYKRQEMYHPNEL